MEISAYLNRVKSSPDSLQFSDVMDIIAAHYDFTPTAFVNGAVSNSADENQGSCKVFAFARLHGLTDAQALACFGEHYRSDMAAPDGTDHQNIRNFMKTGMDSVTFSGAPLSPKL